MKFIDSLLNKSDRYNYYKTNYFKLKKSNKKQQKQISRLQKKLNVKNNKYDMLSKKYNKLKKENKKLLNSYSLFEDNFNDISNDMNNLRNSVSASFDLIKKNNLIDKEIQYALIFNDTIKNSDWVKSKNFSLNNGAANYSFMYVLFRVLDEISPKNILELGLGQTTKLTTQYVNFFKESKLLTIDGDQSWIESFSNKLIIDGNINIAQNDLETFTYNNTENLRYKNLKDTVGDEKFDLIIIDGPQGFFSPGFKMLDYSRSNIWELIPDNLNDNFVIIIDDFERKGEKNTIDVTKKLLEDNNIKYHTFTSIGLKEQHVIASDEYNFVSWF